MAAEKITISKLNVPIVNEETKEIENIEYAIKDPSAVDSINFKLDKLGEEYTTTLKPSQGVLVVELDDKPKQNSPNLVNSGSLYTALQDIGITVQEEYDEYIVLKDIKGNNYYLAKYKGDVYALLCDSGGKILCTKDSKSLIVKNGQVTTVIQNEKNEGEEETGKFILQDYEGDEVKSLLDILTDMTTTKETGSKDIKVNSVKVGIVELTEEVLANLESQVTQNTKDILNKQNALSTAQQNAVDSGITATKVATYDGYATTKQNALSTDQLAAANSGITGTKVTGYDNHLTNTSNPHTVTASQVGLGSVVNTGDSATPVSGGTTKFTTGGAYTLSSQIQGAIGGTNKKGDIWVAGTSYVVGDMMIYNNVLYYCILANSSSTTPTEKIGAYWEVISIKDIRDNKQDKIAAGTANNIVAYSGTAGTVNTLTRSTSVSSSSSDTQIATAKATYTAVNERLLATKSTFTTTAPTAAITDGGIHIVHLSSSEGVTEYNGYIYMYDED